MEELGKVKLSKEEIAALLPEERDEYKRVRTKTARQAVKYALCTASAGAIELITNTVLLNVLPKVMDPHRMITFITEFQLYNFISTFVALFLSILWNFTINRKFTFKSSGNVARAMFLAFLFYVPFFPFKLWFNGFIPMYIVADKAAAIGITAAAYLLAHPIISTAAEVCSMLMNGVLEFCWQKFVIYRKEEDTALAKYEVGEVGPNGEITVAPQTFNSLEIYDMLHAGVDITLPDKELKKKLQELEK